MSERSTIRLLSDLSQNNLILLCIAFLFAVFIGLVETLTGIVVLIAGAVLTAYLLLGPVQWLDRMLARIIRQGKPLLSVGLRRTIAIIGVYLLVAGLIFVIVLRIVPPLVLQTQSFVQDIPQYLQRLQVAAVPTSAQTPHPMAIPHVLAMVASHLVDKFTVIYSQYASKLGGYLLEVGTSAVSLLIYTLTMLVLVFMLLQGGSQLKSGFVELMPERLEEKVSAFLTRFHEHAKQFIKAQALMSLLSGSMIYMLFALLNSKYALLLGVFYGLISIVPVVGPLVGLLVLVSIIAFGESPERILPVVLYVSVFYLLKTYWLWPRMIPKRDDIHPVIFLIVLLASLRLAGWPGVFLSFPLSSMLGVLFDYLRESSAKSNAAC